MSSEHNECATTWMSYNLKSMEWLSCLLTIQMCLVNVVHLAEIILCKELSKQSSPEGQRVLYLYEVLSLKFDSSAKGIGIEKRKGNF